MTVTETPEIAVPEGAIAWSPAVPGNAGHPLDEAPLPYWMSEPCPPWCRRTTPHLDNEPFGQRLHMGANYWVELTLEKPHLDEEEEDPGAYSSAVIDVIMLQHYRDREPRLGLILDYDEEPVLTMGEAAGLAARLAVLLAASAGKVAREAAAGPCPSWCARPHPDTDAPQDRAHVGVYLWLTLTMVDPDVEWVHLDGKLSADTGPAVINARLEQGWSEDEARVVIVYRDRHLNLTLGEARDLSGVLDALLAAAGERDRVDRVLCEHSYSYEDARLSVRRVAEALLDRDGPAAVDTFRRIAATAGKEGDRGGCRAFLEFAAAAEQMLAERSYDSDEAARDAR